MVVRLMLCSVRLVMDYVEVFVLCLQVHRGGLCHGLLAPKSVFYVDGISAYIRLPNSSHVCLSDTPSIIVIYLLLSHIHDYSVKYAMHRQILDCWFLFILRALCVLHL